MPVITKFLGITIFMLYNDHNTPHFHAKYGEYEIIVEINSGVISGRFPPRSLNLIKEWMDLNKNLLLENWYRASNRMELIKIEPLE